MRDLSNDSVLRYGFDLDKNYFVGIGMNAQLIMSIFNTFVCHPFPLFILLWKSKTMTKSIRRLYIGMHAAFITYEVIFFFSARIYPLVPYPGLYYEGPLCSFEVPRRIVLGLISFSIVFVQHPFDFLIVTMHQMFMNDTSPFKLSNRMKYFMASVHLALMYVNVVGFVVLGNEPDNIDELLKVVTSFVEEPELAYYANRGCLLLFGSPGNPQGFRYELIFFYVTLAINFPVLCFFFVHSMIGLKKTSLVAKSAQTQLLTRKMYEVFAWQLNGSVLNHVVPLMAMMIFMSIDGRNFPGGLLAVFKLLLFTLNSTQFCAIFVFKNSVNRQMLIEYILSAIRYATNSKVAPVRTVTPKPEERQASLSMTVV